MGTGSLPGGGTGVPGGTSVFALLDVNDRTAFDNLDMSDMAHLLVRAPAAAAGDRTPVPLCLPTRADAESPVDRGSGPGVWSDASPRKDVSMSQSNAEILRTGYEAFAQGDVPAVLAVFSEDIVWRVPGRNPLSGEYTGHDAVLGFFQALGERSNGTFALDVHDVLDNGEDKVVVVVTETAERNGARLAALSVHLWHLSGGKATSFQAVTDDDYEVDEFWA
jgi:uncharacterized protein